MKIKKYIFVFLLALLFILNPLADAGLNAGTDERPDFITIELLATRYPRKDDGSLNTEAGLETVVAATYKIYQTTGELIRVNPQYEHAKHQFESINVNPYSKYDKWEFEILAPKNEPKTDAAHPVQPMVYDIKEVPIPGYKATYIKDGNVFTLLNTRVIDIRVKKEWLDEDNLNQIRPNQVTFDLLADGVVVASQSVSAADNWECTFKELTKYSNGIEIVYTINEVAVSSDYTSTVLGNVAEGFTVQNSMTTTTTTETETSTTTTEASTTTETSTTTPETAPKKPNKGKPSASTTPFTKSTMTASATGQKIPRTGESVTPIACIGLSLLLAIILIMIRRNKKRA